MFNYDEINEINP